MPIRDVIRGSGQSPRDVLFLRNSDFSCQLDTRPCSASLASGEGILLASPVQDQAWGSSGRDGHDQGWFCTAARMGRRSRVEAMGVSATSEEFLLVHPHC